MSILHKIKPAAAVATLIFGCSAVSHAGLVSFGSGFDVDDSVLVYDGFGYDASRATSGNGFGAVTNLLTLQTPRSGTEEGAVSWDGSSNVLYDPFGNVEPVIGKTSTHALGDLGIDAADELLIAWNPAETGVDPENSVSEAVLLFYAADGTLLLAIELASNPVEHGTVNNGVGGDGFAYVLEGGGITAFNDMIDAASDPASIRIGMYALVGSAGYLVDNGPDTWTVRFTPGDDGQTCHDLGNCPVPEPAPLGILGLGILGIYAIRKRYHLV